MVRKLGAGRLGEGRGGGFRLSGGREKKKRAALLSEPLSLSLVASFKHTLTLTHTLSFTHSLA
jgi:hypothetical protein